ncbi:WD repeat-containing protein tag-125-like [Xyrauchen texanus]|uniref:WD repeat-containing protein tag-125-like n=1 Tax=Xyrauchen texanus TaxID=154827 RepID=UPI0022425A3A|nr:WD repeat-containing protein tag-125-like [Xyrauchen texanus]
MSEKMMTPPVLPVDGPQQIKLMTKCTDLFSVSRSETDTDGDSECEPDNDSDTSSEEQHLEQQQFHMSSDTHPQESHSPQTQPKTNGDLHIHTVLDCGFEVMTCQFSEDGSMLAAGLNDGSIKVYGTDSGELIQTLKDNSSSLFSMPVTALRFIVIGQSHCQILATYASGDVCCWYVWGGQKLWESNEASEAGVQRQTLSLSVSLSGEQALTGGSDSVIHLYDLTTHQRLQSFSASSSRTVMDGHRFRVFAVTFHPESVREFISGGWDNTIQANNHFSCNNSSQIHSIHSMSNTKLSI